MKRIPKRIAFSAALAGAVVVSVSAAAWAWWESEHALAVRAAVKLLPADMPRFFREGGDTIASYASDPDHVRLRDLPALAQAERPEHFMDLEDLKGAEIPPDRRAYYRFCNDRRIDPFFVGTLPYAIQEYYGRLAVAFAEHRRAPADERIQAKILYLAGLLSHYAADAAQPLHTTVHFDGRAKRGEPSPRTGIHDRMDVLPLRVGLTQDELTRAVDAKEPAETPAAPPADAAFALAVAQIKRSHARVDSVYELDPLLPQVTGPRPDRVDPRVRALALECMRDAVRLTADLWKSAWTESARLRLKTDEQAKP